MRCAAAPCASPWIRSGSVSCSSTVRYGFSDVIGSWKIIPMRRPRMRRSADSSPWIRSTPSKRASSASTWPGGRGIRPSSERHATDFPDPDSPTMPSVSPRSSWNETSLTARTTPCRVWNAVRRPLTSRSATPLVPGRAHVERIAQAVAHEVERKERQREERGGIEQQPRRFLHHLCALLDEKAPGGHRRLHAEAEEAEERLEQHHRRNRQRRIDGDRAEHVRDQMAQDDPVLAQTERDGGLDEFLPLQREHLAAHDARHRQPLDRADRDEQQHEVAPEYRHQQDHEDREWQRIKDVDDAHHYRVDLAAEIRSDRSPQHADREGDRGRGDP